MPDHDFRCGDVLYCTSQYYAQQLNIEGQYGIVMGTKPNHIHLWFESNRRSFWLNYDILRRPEGIELTPLFSRIQLLTYALKAEEWELEQTEDSTKLLCYIDEVSFETLQELKMYLDFEYQSMTLSPEGMGRMIVQIQWSR